MGVLTCPCDQILAGARDAGADSTYPHASNLGRLLVRVAQHLGEDESFAAVFRQGVDKSAGVYPLAPRCGIFRRCSHCIFIFSDRFAWPGHIVANIIHPYAPRQGE